jgi:hypothetical protein
LDLAWSILFVHSQGASQDPQEDFGHFYARRREAQEDMNKADGSVSPLLILKDGTS